MKRILFAMVMALVCMTSGAQDKWETGISADLVSTYVWRGLELGHVSVQPSLEVAYKGLSFSAWGNVGISHPDDTKEFDLAVAYTLGGFNVALTDFWTSDGGDPRTRYFMYESHRTNHVFELNLGYDFGFACLQWFTNFAGNDYKKKDGKRAYSSYVEVVVPFKLSAIEWTATAGAVLYETDYYNSGTSGFAVTNLALKAFKDIKITDTFSVPMFAEVSANPCTQKTYLVLGFMLHP